MVLSVDSQPVPAAFDVPSPSFAAVDEPGVRKLCSQCHQCPEPDVLPRYLWPETIWQMYENAGYGRAVSWRINPEDLVEWFQSRAPERLDLAIPRTALAERPLSFEKRAIKSNLGINPFTSDIKSADLTGDGNLELLVSDMRNGLVMMADLEHPGSSCKRLGDVPNPARMCIADLDQDGLDDVLVANLGSFAAMDHNLGSVEWFRAMPGGSFERVTLASELGRVADVQAEDIDGDEDLDLLVAEFGWKSTGHLLVFENISSPQGFPEFKQHAIDGLAGANQVAGVDFNNDGLRDIVVLYSQGREVVRCYVQRDKLLYEIVDLYRAPHPAWGFIAFQLVDLDQDQDLDVLLSNGDTFDNSLIKPDHGVRWLENEGELKFHHHELAQMYGAYCAQAADMDGDGDMDIVACALVADSNMSGNALAGELDSIALLEQTATGEFIYHTLESGSTIHPTLTLADVDLDGTTDLLVGDGRLQHVNEPDTHVCVELWKTTQAN